MIPNYELSEDGVIKQISRNPFTYDLGYVSSRYETYGELTERMSHLRLGFIVGTLGRLPSSLMDIGYGNGSFLSLCKKGGVLSYGFDVSDWPLPDGCARATRLDQDVECATFFDSLEHFVNIDQVAQLKAKFVFISVPWCHYHSDEWFESWKHRRPDEHLWHFNEISLRNFMYRHGYELLSYSALEDLIRVSQEPLNILTAAFSKID